MRGSLPTKYLSLNLCVISSETKRAHFRFLSMLTIVDFRFIRLGHIARVSLKGYKILSSRACPGASLCIYHISCFIIINSSEYWPSIKIINHILSPWHHIWYLKFPIHRMSHIHSWISKLIVIVKILTSVREVHRIFHSCQIFDPVKRWVWLLIAISNLGRNPWCWDRCLVLSMMILSPLTLPCLSSFFRHRSFCFRAFVKTTFVSSFEHLMVLLHHHLMVVKIAIQIRNVSVRF